jgi:hypothetical protein
MKNGDADGTTKNQLSIYYWYLVFRKEIGVK